MLKLEDINILIEGRPLFEGASVTIPEGHKVGFVGRNGSGKTTLFKVILNEIQADSGTVHIPKGARIGGVRQEVPSSSTSLLDTVLGYDLERTALLNELESDPDPNRIADIYTRLGDIDAYSAEARAASILHGLGFDAKAQLQACSEFSGGWRMRVALAGVLFSQPDFLLLDEPTNYLDLEGTIWLENYLATYPHTVLLISHDRNLLNRSVGAILHLSDRNLTLYSGNYDTFDNTRRAHIEAQASMAKRQNAQREHMQAFVDRFRAKASKAKQAQSRLKALEKLQPIATGVEQAVAGFLLPNPEELAPPIIRIEDGRTGYGEKVILDRLNLRIDTDDRIALLGANGQGKSTLTKLLTGDLPLMKGTQTKASKLRIGYFAQHQVDTLNLDETPLQHLVDYMPGAPESKRRAKLASGGLNVDQADVLVRNLSGGQKARLALLLMVMNDPHIIILDEPTNHLDIESRDMLVRSLSGYTGAVVLVSHDPFLINAVADQLWLVSDGGVEPFEGDMDAYRRFLLKQRGGKEDAKSKEQEKPKAKPKQKRESSSEIRKKLAPLQAELTKCEERITKLEDMKEKIEARIADPSFYTNDSAEKIEAMNIKHGEVLAALTKAEKLWELAQEKLDSVKNV